MVSNNTFKTGDVNTYIDTYIRSQPQVLLSRCAMINICDENHFNYYQQTHDIDIDKYLAQIDIELEQVTGLSEIFGDCMANYFNTVQKIVDIIWDKGDSLVGVGCCGGVTNKNYCCNKNNNKQS